MRQIVLLVISFFFAGLISCTQEKKPEQSQQNTEVKSLKACYLSAANKDTVSLTFDVTDHKVTGLLVFNLYEKDKNQGTIKGELKGDTLIVDYTFLSEGVTSIREVVFLKRNNQLVEGFGEMKTIEGKEVFKSRSDLSFNNSLVLTAIECEKN